MYNFCKCHTCVRHGSEMCWARVHVFHHTYWTCAMSHVLVTCHKCVMCHEFSHMSVTCQSWRDHVILSVTCQSCQSRVTNVSQVSIVSTCQSCQSCQSCVVCHTCWSRVRHWSRVICVDHMTITSWSRVSNQFVTCQSCQSGQSPDTNMLVTCQLSFMCRSHVG